MSKRQVKVGLTLDPGSGSDYQWSVVFLSLAERDASFLRQPEYWHVVDQIRTLACEDDPTKPQMVSVDQIGKFHELRIKGGPLSRKNVRVFFFVGEGRQIVILGCIKKEKDGSTPPATKKLMEIRKRKYLNGDYGQVL